ncbi:MAG: methionyl-tRNA formyltransferase [Flavobacteriaceae bacterium]|nr:methionyl-tRNA formyltransferase [Flavobacteriaceae bacterium]
MNHLGYKTNLVFDSNHVVKGNVLILLSCEKIFKKLKLNDFNIVVHESKLPKGKGFSPMTWQVLEGKTRIPISLFEATKKVDSGRVYFQDFIKLDGFELIDEIREKQANKTKELILNFLKKINNLKVIQKRGEESFYRRRTSKDSMLDINKTIKEQFNLLRVVDNLRYPAYFKIGKNNYKIEITKMN